MDKRTIRPEPIIFGSPKTDVRYTERRAAYLVMIDDGRVAMVKSGQNHFLPGGGSLPGETPEETVAREVHEELGRGVRLFEMIGEAIQYFYSSADNRDYKMAASFFAGELTDEFVGLAEHTPDWIPLTEVERACFHECHVWAIRRA